MSAPQVTCTKCEESVPETEIPPSFLTRGIRVCRRCTRPGAQNISPQRLPDQLPVATPEDWEGYLRRRAMRELRPVPGYTCGRCGGESGLQGHLTRVCAAGNISLRDVHVCCPGDCELTNG